MSLTFSAALCASLNAYAETIEVQDFKYAGPYAVALPWMADSVNVKGEPFSMENLLDSPLSFTLLPHGKKVTSLTAIDTQANALHLASSHWSRERAQPQGWAWPLLPYRHERRTME